MEERIEKFYDQYVYQEWTRRDRHPLEFIIIEHYLKKFLFLENFKIADIGGGPGRYAVTLAQWGHTVSLIDLSKANIDFARSKVCELGLEKKITEIDRGDSRDLSRFEDETFDVVLLMGPLYHLIHEEDRVRTLLEVKRILKKDGLMFTTFLNRYTPIIHMLTNWPEGILEKPEQFNFLLEEGHSFDFIKVKGNLTFAPAYYIRVQEIRPLIENAGFQVIKLIACQSILGGRNIDKLSNNSKLYQAWVDFVLATCEDEATFGSSTHLLCISKK